MKEISGDNWCLAFSYKRSFFNQQAEIVAMEGEEYWPKLKASVSSSLEEPLLELANMNMSPQPKLIKNS